MDNLNVKRRITEDTLEINERTFKIRKFDPLLGNYILMQCMTFILPFGISDMISSKVPGVGSVLNNASQKKMSKSDFLELQRDILSHASEVLPGNTTPVVREDGTYGIIDFSAPLAIQLIIALLAFNFSDFFEENVSSILGTVLQGSQSVNTTI